MLVEAGVFAAVSAAMFVSTVGFIAFYMLGNHNDRYFFVPPAITAVAGLAYAGMAASSHGLIAADVILELRYVDWLITTPLIVLHIGLVAGASRRTIGAAMAADAVMIAAGFVATTSTGAVSWAGFAVSSAAFLAVVYLLLTSVTAGVRGETAAVQGTFRTLRDLTIALWAVYPLIWLVGPYAGGVIALADYHFIIAVLDTTAKVGFSAIVAFGMARVGDLFESADAVPAPE